MLKSCIAQLRLRIASSQSYLTAFLVAMGGLILVGSQSMRPNYTLLVVGFIGAFVAIGVLFLALCVMAQESYELAYEWSYSPSPQVGWTCALPGYPDGFVHLYLTTRHGEPAWCTTAYYQDTDGVAHQVEAEVFTPAEGITETEMMKQALGLGDLAFVASDVPWGIPAKDLAVRA